MLQREAAGDRVPRRAVTALREGRQAHVRTVCACMFVCVYAYVCACVCVRACVLSPATSCHNAPSVCQHTDGE